MDEIGTATVEVIRDPITGYRSRRISRADPRVRISGELVEDFRAGATFANWFHLDGDVLTIRDDYGQRYIYRIRWDDYADGGYLAEWPD